MLASQPGHSIGEPDWAAGSAGVVRGTAAAGRNNWQGRGVGKDLARPESV